MRSSGLSVRASNSLATSAGVPVRVELAQLGLQRHGRCLGVGRGVEVQRHAVGDARAALDVHEAAQARDHGLGQLVLARQLGQGVAGSALAVGAAGVHAGVLQRHLAAGRRRASRPSFRYCSSLPTFTL